MDVLTIIGVLAALIGIPAAFVQVLDYLQKRRQKRDERAEKERSSPLPTVIQVPHNLPPRSEFIGREREKARVHEALQSRSYLISIDGIGGIGKTVLALEVAHECLRASRNEEPTDGMATFDGLIWTTAKDRHLTLNDLLDAIARTLEYPGIAQQPVEEKRDAVQKLLREKPYLLIVDNFETITDDAVRGFLLSLPEPSKALITTREQKLRQVWSISLKGLTESEALTLIRSEGRRLSLTSLERGEGRVLLHLYQATGGAPLAIKWAVGQIKQRGQSLDTVLAALHGARGNIFDNIFHRSWSLLSPTARQVLIVMPLFATSAPRTGIEAASDVYHFALDEALGQLVEMSLVDATDELELTQRRYSIHPLTRAFAGVKLHDASEVQQAARKRLAEFYRTLTEKHGGFWSQEGFTQLELELPNALAVIQQCWEERYTDLAMRILVNISDFLILRGYWNDAMGLGQRAVSIATEESDEFHAAVLRVHPIGWLFRHRGDLDAAEEHVVWALAVFERLGEEFYIARSKRNLGRIFHERGDLNQAEQLLRDALAFYRTSHHKRLFYLTTANLAGVVLEQGKPDTAWELCHTVLDEARHFDDPERVSHLVGVLGHVAYQRGDLELARTFRREALEQVKRAQRPDATADALFLLAQLEIEIGEEQTARQRLLEALEIYERLDIQSKVQEVETLLAELKGNPTDEE